MARDDDAREIPQRRPSRRPDPATGRPRDDEFDDAFVVDTRGASRRPSPQPRQDAPRQGARRQGQGGQRPDQNAPRSAQGAPRTTAARTQRSRDDAMPRTRVMPVVERPRQGGAAQGSTGEGTRPPGRTGGPRRPAAVSAPRRRGFGIRRAVGLVLLLLVAWAGFTVYAPVNAWGGVDRVDDSPSGDRPADGDGHDYLLVGSDSREGLTQAEISDLGTGGVKGNEGQRTDSIILVHVPSGGGKKVMISIPRDSYVPIPGHGSDKINAAYAIGGPKLLIQTIEQVTDVRIDGYLEIGFGGFAKLVDAMGGVNICVPFDMNDEKAHINLKKGCQDLDGKNALGYVRARYSDPRGDIGRAQRQRQFLGAIMHKMATPSTVLIPTRWWATTHNAVAGLTVGEDTSMWDAYRIVSAMRGVSSDDTLSLVVPISDPGYQTPAGESVKWDTQRARELFRHARRGHPDRHAPGRDGRQALGRLRPGHRETVVGRATPGRMVGCRPSATCSCVTWATSGVTSSMPSKG